MCVLFLSSCRATRIAQSHSSENRADSIHSVETIRDTVIRIAPDSSLVQALLECDSLGRVRLRELLKYQNGERLKPPKIAIKDNVLTVTAEIDSMEVYLQLKDRYTYESHLSDKTTTNTVEVNVLTKWQRAWMRVGQIMALIIGIYLIIKIKKL